jgi:hypothetical protein
MVDPDPTLEEWSRLYEAAIGVKAMAPWDWMQEGDIFGVQNPENSEIGFVGVMGGLGEHLSVAVYLGAGALSDFWTLYQFGDQAPAEAVLEIRHLQASFEDREMLRSKDRDIIKALGLRFRGRQAWPLFRSYRSGYAPWHLEAWEARFLAHALDQTMEVGPRLKKAPTMLDDLDTEDYLVRVLRKGGQVLQWEDQIVRVEPVDRPLITIKLTRETLQQAQQLPRTTHSLEVEAFMAPMPMADEEGQRPYFPHMLLVVERDSGMVLGSELVRPKANLEATWGSLANVLLHLFVNLGSVPAEIRVRTPLEAGLFEPLGGELGVDVRVAQTLRSLDQAREFMGQFMA